MRIQAVINQKGGVGKTTTAANLGAALAARGQRVLLVDLDPQGNLSTHVGIDIYNLERSLYDVLTRDYPIAKVVHPTSFEGLYCVPSNIDLSSAEVEMVSAVGRETILKEALDTLVDAEPGPFDIVLIDCPPSLGLLSINALSASADVLIPMQTEFFALQGMSKLMEVVGVVKKRLNPGLELRGIIACRMDMRTRLAAEVLDDIAAHFPNLLYKTRIRQDVKLAEAPSFGQTIIEYDRESKGAKDYSALADEMLAAAMTSAVLPEATSENTPGASAQDVVANDAPPASTEEDAPTNETTAASSEDAVVDNATTESGS